MAAVVLGALAVTACSKNEKKPAEPTESRSARTEVPRESGEPIKPARLSFSEKRAGKLPDDIPGLVSYSECAKSYGPDPATLYTDVDQDRAFARCKQGDAEQCNYAYAAVHYRHTGCVIRVSLEGCLAGEPTLCSYALATKLEDAILFESNGLPATEASLDDKLITAAYGRACSLGDAKGCQAVASRLPGAIDDQDLAAHFAWACERNDPFGCHERAVAMWPSREDPEVRKRALEAMKVACAVGSDGAWVQDSCIAAILLQQGKTAEFERLNPVCTRGAAFVNPEVCMAVARRLPPGQAAPLWRDACSGIDEAHPWARDCPTLESSDEELATRLLLGRFRNDAAGAHQQQPQR